MMDKIPYRSRQRREVEEELQEEERAVESED
jgi:hypothetical protein